MEKSTHLILTRFAVPRDDAATAERYRSRDWLAGRLALFRRFYVPSVARLEVPAVLLCGSRVAEWVAAQVADLEWVRVEVQDDWRGALPVDSGTVVTRLDSDDAVHRGWLKAVDAAPPAAGICVTRDFLRWDTASGRLHRYVRREPSPLAAFRGGRNPFELDHKHLDRLPGVHSVSGEYLLEVVHGGNLKNRRPKAWRIDRRVNRRRLADFGLSPGELDRGA